jgi:hypothetical protein
MSRDAPSVNLNGVAFLASDRSSNTTGSYLLSDGGYTAH